MATINQVTYDIREAVKKYSDDSELDDRYIKYLLNIKRAKYLKQKVDQLGRAYNNRVLQTFCLELEEVSTNECGLDFECDTMLRTKKKLPQLLQLSTKDALQRVSPSNRLSQKFNLISRERAESFLNSPYNAKTKAFIHDDGYIYLISSDIILVECISITGIFEDPEALSEYNTCCDCDNVVNTCFDPDVSEYPIQTELLDLIRIDVIKELTSLDRIQEDMNNNSQDD